MTQHPLWKPKFLMTAFVMVSGTVALFAHLIADGSWVTLMNLSLATFTAASVTENKLTMK
jgi:hypothetical protein